MGASWSFFLPIKSRVKRKGKKIQIFQNTRNGKYYFSDTRHVKIHIVRSLKGQNQVCEINTITLEAQPSESATNFDHCGDENRCR